MSWAGRVVAKSGEVQLDFELSHGMGVPWLVELKG